MTSVYPVIPKRSEESHKSLLPKNLRFRNSASQSYYQQADSMTYLLSCYQLADSMTEKHCFGIKLLVMSSSLK